MFVTDTPRRSFQSTLPVRGATSYRLFFYAKIQVISIHAPRAGSDGALGKRLAEQRIFQSTLPVRGATQSLSC